MSTHGWHHASLYFNDVMPKEINLPRRFILIVIFYTFSTRLLILVFFHFFLPETDSSSPVKINGWKMILSFWDVALRIYEPSTVSPTCSNSLINWFSPRRVVLSRGPNFLLPTNALLLQQGSSVHHPFAARLSDYRKQSSPPTALRVQCSGCGARFKTNPEIESPGFFRWFFLASKKSVGLVGYLEDHPI